MQKQVRVSLIGYKFMGKAHSHAYRDVDMFFPLRIRPIMKVICGRSEEGVKAAQERLGWEEYETDWRRVVEREDIDLVDISTPVSSHRDIALAAARKGKDIFCEKPLAMNLEQAGEMLEAAKKAGIKHMVGFNYRRVPAIALARRLIQEGKLGKIYHFRAHYLQDWLVDPEFPLVWRLRKEEAGSGALGDLGAHIVDLAHYLVGEFDEVMGVKETFIKERLESRQVSGLRAKAKAGRGKVTVDDATLFLARFKNGALGNFEASRFATGRKNYEYIEINGSKGSLVFVFEKMNELQFFSQEGPGHVRGFRTILVTEEVHPYIKAWWPPGHLIGYEHTFVHEIYDLLKCLAEDRMPQPNFEEGVKCHRVLDAVERSIEERSWVKVTSSGGKR